ncbi:MAG: hypothetical protein F4Z97_04175, partial [Gammaproteobacteria bacterium]|nr:hypothetical protein [Gammaproteobacteria bacterium]
TDDGVVEADETVVLTLNPGNNNYRLGENAKHTMTIVDDDAAVLSIAAPADAVEGESGATDRFFTVSFARPVDSEVRYRVCFSGTAAIDLTQAGEVPATADYQPLTGGSGAPVAGTTRCVGATHAAGDLSTSDSSIGIRVRGDSDAEGDETVTATLELVGTPPASVTLGDATATHTIFEDDAAVLSIAAPEDAYEGDSGTDDRFFTVRLAKPLSDHVGFRVCFSGSAAIDLTKADPIPIAADYQPLTGGAPDSNRCVDGVVTAGTRQAQVGFRVRGDTAAEPDETVVANLTLAPNSPSTASLGTTSAVHKILDEDNLPVIKVDAPSVIENFKENVAERIPLEFTVTLSPTSHREVTVDYADDGSGTATSDVDYFAVTGGTLNFAAGESQKTVTVMVKEDNRFEGDEIVVLKLSSPVNARLAASTAAGTIQDNDTEPSEVTLETDVTAVSESASATSVKVTATLVGDVRFDEDKTVAVKVVDGTTTVPDDRSDVEDFDIVIPAGRRSAFARFTLRPVDDDLDEDNETIRVKGAVTGLTVTEALIELTDDDPTPSLSIASGSAVEGGMAAFDVTLSEASSRDVTVTAASSSETGDTASAGDFEQKTESLTIAAGSTAVSFGVGTTTDTLHETDETFTVKLSEPMNAKITAGSGSVVGKIQDDDVVPSVTLTTDVATLSEAAVAAPVTVTATLGGGTQFGSDQQVTVEVGGDSDSAVEGPQGDYAAVQAFALDIVAGMSSGSHTFTLLPIDDALNEKEETISVTGTLPDAVVAGTSIAVTDDDQPPRVSIESADAVEGGTLSFTLRLSAVSGLPVSVTAQALNVSGDTATANSDYTTKTETLTIAAGERTAVFEVATTDDNIRNERAETFTARLSQPVNATIGRRSTKGTIEDNDGYQPRVNLTSDVTMVDEDSGQVTVTVTATKAGGGGNTSRSASFTLKVGDGTAKSPADFSAAPAQRTVSLGSKRDSSGTASFTLTPVDDTLDEDEETIRIYGTGSALNVREALIAIADNDPTPTISIVPATGAEGDRLRFAATLSAPSGR